MQTEFYKVESEGRTYFAWTPYPHTLNGKVEPVEDTPYVRSACNFWQGVWGWTDMALAERIIVRMVNGECLWHAIAQETGKPCHCAKCSPRR